MNEDDILSDDSLVTMTLDELEHAIDAAEARGYKAGLDAAVKVCKNFAERDMHPAECAGAIERLPVPEVQWRDLTDDELKAFHHIEEFGLFCDVYEFIDIARTVIAKFKEVNNA